MSLNVCQSPRSKGTFVLPNTTAPAATRPSTAAAFRGAMLWRSAGTPQVVGRPATSKASLTVIGTPCSGPQISPPGDRLVRVPRPRLRALGVKHHDRVQTRVVSLNAREMKVEQLEASDAPRADSRGERNRRAEDQLHRYLPVSA